MFLMNKVRIGNLDRFIFQVTRFCELLPSTLHSILASECSPEQGTTIVILGSKPHISKNDCHIRNQQLSFWRSEFTPQVQIDSIGSSFRVMVASKFQPTYARQAFPCFDEPEYKATYDITLVKPTNYVALSNMNVSLNKIIIPTMLFLFCLKILFLKTERKWSVFNHILFTFTFTNFVECRIHTQAIILAR